MTLPGPKPTPRIDRIMARVVETPGPMDSPCWVTDYATTPAGYVTVSANGRLARAHRCTYEHFVGPIPEGFDLDHLCRVRACVNPDHLEAVTRAENLRRGGGGMSARDEFGQPEGEWSDRDLDLLAILEEVASPDVNPEKSLAAYMADIKDLLT